MNTVLTKEQLLELGWFEDNVEMAIEAQDTLTEYETVFVTNISTDDEDLLAWLEENPTVALKVEHYELETFAVWIEGCEYAIQLTECELFGTDLEGEDLERVLALIEHLNLPIEAIDNITDDGNNSYTLGDNEQEYLVLTETERFERVKEDIENSVCYFNPSFLAEQTDYDLLPIFEALVDSRVNEWKLCEAIICLIEKYSSFEDFVIEACNQDGYGHFISHYDGEEHEVGEYFIYRYN